MSRILNPAIFKSGRTKLIEALQKERKDRKEVERGRKRAEGDLRGVTGEDGGAEGESRCSPESPA